MYLGVDIGGTKTLVATLTNDGVITEKTKFPTPQDYEEFLEELAVAVDSFTTKDFLAAGLGMPVTNFDRAERVGVSYGNLAWKDVPVQADFERIVSCPTVVENDAKLAGLSEAMLLKKYAKVLYITVSTGIGYGLINNQVIDTSIGDGGGAVLLLEYKGKLATWESFASGHAIVQRFGKRAEDIHDEATWKRICHDLVPGFMELIAITEADVIVVGGSVGTYFERYHEFLKDDLAKFETPLLKIPPLLAAKRPEEAVIYGCYDLAKQTYGKNA
jgi:predicted NBD/HSP70 family sugar kinase